MKEKDKLVILEAQFYRSQRRYDEALVLLHKLANKYPDNTTCYFLLAAFYFEVKETDVALEYCDKSLVIDPLHNESKELKGLIHIEKKEYDEAKTQFLEILKNKLNYFQAHIHLISLYHNQYQDYERTIKHCEYLLANKDPNRDKYTKKEKRKTLEWLMPVNSYYISSLLKTKQFREALNAIEEDVDYKKTFVDNFQGFFLHQELDSYKLNLLLNDLYGIKYWEKYLTTNYNIDLNFILTLNKEAQDYKFSH